MYRPVYNRPRRHPRRWIYLLVILGLLVLVFLLLAQWLHSLMQPYFPVNYQTRVAQVRVIQAHTPHRMSVELTIFDNDGHPVSETYSLLGDEWRLEADMITSPGVLNVIGLYSGYKLTRLDGRYDNEQASNTTGTVVTLNGGDDGFFKALYDNHTPVVEATKFFSNYFQPDGKTYNVFLTHAGLSVVPAS